MNLCLTSVCNNHCPYCFQNNLQQKAEWWSLEDIEKFIKWTGDFPVLTVLGGEPTLYPHLNEFLDLVEKRDPPLTLNFISNLLGPTAAIERLAQFDPTKIGFLVNTTYDDDKEEIFKKHLAILKGYNDLDISITLFPNYEINKKYIFRAINYAQEKNLYTINAIRVGLMTPKPTDKLKTIYNYDKELTLLFDELNKHGLNKTTVHFDCAINYCQISKSILDILVQFPNFELSSLHTSCTNGGPIDVWPNHQIVVCSSSSDSEIFSVYKMEDFKNYKECETRIKRLADLYKTKNKKCLHCNLFIENICHPCHAFDEALLRGEKDDDT